MQPLVDTEWLAENLEQVRVLDGSWYLSSANRDAAAEFETAHIPGAEFFDIDQVSDHSTPLPHMLPNAEDFAKAVGSLGISNADQVVVYDGAGMFSAARVWWTFRVFGHDGAAILDGGLPKWAREGRPVTNEQTTRPPGTFTATLQPDLLRTIEQMQANLQNKTHQVVDARGRERFAARAPEPREGVRGGHIPGSTNLPYSELLETDGTFRSVDALRSAFKAAGVAIDDPVATTCGSGITASILAFALFLLGNRGVAVYDGSWSEWGSRTDTPVEAG